MGPWDENTTGTEPRGFTSKGSGQAMFNLRTGVLQVMKVWFRTGAVRPPWKTGMGGFGCRTKLGKT